MVSHSLLWTSSGISDALPSAVFMYAKKPDVKMGAHRIWSIAVLDATANAEVGALVMIVRSRNPYQ